MWDEEASLPTKPAWPQATPTECFRTYVQAHLLGMLDFESRRKGAEICHYAWDIALLSDKAMRDQQIERLWRSCEPLMPELLQEGLAIDFMQELQALVARKRDLLPMVTTFIDTVRLEVVDDTTDRLVVTTAAGVDELSIHFKPDPAGTPSFGRHLNRLHNLTEDLADWLHRILSMRRLTHEAAAEVAVICGMRRVELAGYRELSARLNAIQTAPAARRVTAEWVNMADEIDAQIMEVLAVLG